MKILDWSKMPSGVPVLVWDDGRYDFKESYEFIRFESDKEFPFICKSRVHLGYEAKYQYAELREQGQFTYWPGGKCPLPDGMMVEVVFRYGGKAAREPSSLSWRCNYEQGDIIAYRILGLADGWKYPHEVENEDNI